MSTEHGDRLPPAPAGNELSTGSKPVRLPAEFDTPSGLAALLRHHGVDVEFDPPRHPDLVEFDRALAEFESRCACVCPGCRDREHCAGIYCDQVTA